MVSYGKEKKILERPEETYLQLNYLMAIPVRTWSFYEMWTKLVFIQMGNSIQVKNVYESISLLAMIFPWF